MEQRFLFGLLMWGEGNLTPNYILFCVFGSFGALQFVAGKYARFDLTPFRSPLAQLVGILFLVFAFVWFFTIQPDLFIPGLAGGEFVVYSFIGFSIGYVISRLSAWLATRVAPRRARAHASRQRESQSE